MCIMLLTTHTHTEVIAVLVHELCSRSYFLPSLALFIKVIAGQFLSESRVFVEVESYGLPADTHRREHRTRPVLGPHPLWGEEGKGFAFRKVSKWCSLYPDPFIYKWFD